MKRLFFLATVCLELCLFGSEEAAFGDDATLQVLAERIETLETSPNRSPASLDSLAHQLGTLETIYDYVATQITHEAYAGRLKGPEGTLRSGSGNAVDQSELLRTMLHIVGVQCRYAKAKRATPEGTHVDHLWVQIHNQNEWEDLDPAFPELTRGGELHGHVITMTELPQNLNHTVRIDVKYRFAVAGRKQQKSALVHVLHVADLYAQPLTLSNRFTGRREVDRFMVTEVQPILQLGTKLFPGVIIPEQDGKVKPRPSSRLFDVFGQTETEQDTPQDGSSEARVEILAQWVELQIISPGSPRRRIVYTIFDREWERDASLSSLGGLITAVAFGFSPVEVEKDDLVIGLAACSADIRALIESLRLLSPHGSTGNINTASISPEEAERLNQALEQGQRILAWSLLQQYLQLSDQALGVTSEEHGVHAYRGAPRAIMACVSYRDEEIRFDLDLQENPATYVFAENASEGLREFLQYHRGVYESQLEGAVMQSITGHAGITAGDIMFAAQEQGIPLRVVVKQLRRELSSCTLEHRAKVLINQALSRGRTVLVPERPVLVEGKARMAWYEYDPATGSMVGVFPSGKHQSMTEYFNEETVITTLVSQGMSYFSSMVAGYYFSVATGLGHFYACLLDLEDPGKPCFGQPAVCEPATRDAMVFCKAWKEAKKYWDMAGAVQGLDLAGLVPWPDAWETLAGDPCERGISYGLQWFGCGQ